MFQEGAHALKGEYPLVISGEGVQKIFFLGGGGPKDFFGGGHSDNSK